ncbi:MAG: hypothetical protein COS92_01070 [Desulfobacterales bacterium CG07_land_8_20_14_0_80_52_14]|nr:MAG: hypothetical protein COX20_05085 [Desulfobacterales bacterium CG23_combo_of_CG06-09_8_20_14_all_52_9]PIU50496.1 MAG: hypothetical protein COS92_01070 [Desulfobacterales bacterium CG07_land_8_20_14_0_80_52_14]
MIFSKRAGCRYMKFFKNQRKIEQLKDFFSKPDWAYLRDGHGCVQNAWRNPRQKKHHLLGQLALKYTIIK